MISSEIKKVIVTGGCGFIGSHVVEQLLEQGYHVTVVDNMTTGTIFIMIKIAC